MDLRLKLSQQQALLLQVLHLTILVDRDWETVRFREGEEGAGITAADINNASGFTITVTNANNYTFTASGTANETAKIGGGSISAGPVTLSA